MNELIISEAQDYLTVRKNEDDYKRIVDIMHLLKNHDVNEVTRFLNECLRDKEKALRNMILIDKTNSRIDKFAGAIFRIMMAIKVLEGKEVNIIEKPEQGTKKGRILQTRNSGGNKRRGIWQNPDHDVTDRLSRNAL
jgi:hypothetical protein